MDRRPSVTPPSPKGGVTPSPKSALAVESALAADLAAAFDSGRAFQAEYTIESRINASARQNRAIYAARRVADGAMVAVKVISKTYPRALSSDEVDALRREAVIHHFACGGPNVVALLDFFETASKLYLVMEHMAGGDLLAHVASHADAHFSEDEARNLLRPIADTLAWLHSHGICHRDLKPSNVLLTADGEPKISDFGLSAVISTGMSTPVGTRTFAAPELLSSFDALHDASKPATAYSEAVDLWALGCIMYVVLVGILPPAPIAFPASVAISAAAQTLITALVDPNPDARPHAAAVVAAPWFSAAAWSGSACASPAGSPLVSPAADDTPAYATDAVRAPLLVVPDAEQPEWAASSTPLASAAILRGADFSAVHNSYASALNVARDAERGYTLLVGPQSGTRPVPTARYLLAFAGAPVRVEARLADADAVELHYFSVTLRHESAIDRFIARRTEALYPGSVGVEALGIIDELYGAVDVAADAVAGAVAGRVGAETAHAALATFFAHVDSYIPEDVRALPTRNVPSAVRRELRGRISVADVKLFAFVTFLRASADVAAVLGSELDVPASVRTLCALMAPLFPAL